MTSRNTLNVRARQPSGRAQPGRWLALVVALLLLQLQVSIAHAAAELLPNLRTAIPRDLLTERTPAGRTLLRFTNEVDNAGPGVLEVFPADGQDCNGDGDPTNDRLAFQRIYSDGNADGLFERPRDRKYRTVLAGCMEFHPAHNHWHVDDFARYELRSDLTGILVRSSEKVSFCLRDSRQFDPTLTSSPAKPYYDQCSATAPMGISVGWADIYDAALPGQEFDVTELPPGPYCLASTVDPANRLAETTHADNRAETRFALLVDGTVRISHEPCSQVSRGA